MRTPALTLASVRLAPEGEPAGAAGHCALCAAPYEEGDLVAPFKPGDNFMDGRSVRNEPGVKPFLCGACEALRPKPRMLKLQKAIITEDGAYPITRGEFRAWFILHPPKPPFAVIFSDSKLQHLLWRTPVTLDADHWNIQMGARTLVMRRLVVLAAYQACQTISASYLAATKKQARSPFLSLDPELGDLNTGRLNPKMQKFAIENGLTREIEILQNLLPGDLWGLSSVVFKGGIAALPEPIDINRPPSPKEEAEPVQD